MPIIYSEPTDQTPIVDDNAMIIQFLVDGNGFTVTEGIKTPYIFVPFNCTIVGWSIRGSASDTYTIDVLYSSSISGTPASICGAGIKPSVSAQTSASGSNVSGWSTTLTKDGILTVDIIGTETGMPASATWVSFELKVNRT